MATSPRRRGPERGLAGSAEGQMLDKPSSQVRQASDQAQAPFSATTVVAALGAVFFAILLRSSWLNVFFVPLCSGLILLNPWVRTFLDLKPVSEGQSGETLSTFDPARIVRLITGQPTLSSEQGTNTEGTQTEVTEVKAKVKQPPLDRTGAYAALRRMPASLRTPLSDLEELIIRDCVCTWYNYHSFADPSFPNEARFSIDHAMGSLFHGMEQVKSADVTAELLLAAASVLLVTLRYRRLYPDRAPIFSSDQMRIQALREGLDRVFARHFRQEDVQCDILRTLLREIVCKQIWNAVCGIGEPDFINQQIVGWHERQKAKELQPEHGYLARNGAVVAPSAPSSRASPQLSQFTTPERRQSPLASRKPVPSSTGQDNAADTHSRPNYDQPPVTPSAPNRPAPLTMTSEPLTKQPKAMTMPSPLAKSSMSSSSSSAPRAPFDSMQSPMGPRSGASESFGRSAALPQRVGSPAKAANKGGYSSSPEKSNIGLPSIAGRGEHDREGGGPPPQSPANLLQHSQTSDDTLTAWDDVVPMNVPPSAHQGMHLPDSLRKSMKSKEDERKDTQDGRADGQDGYKIRDDDNDDANSKSTSARLDRPSLQIDRPTGTMDEHPLALSSPMESVPRPSSQASLASDAPGLAIKPPSRAPSAAAGGIPPAPELSEVLSSKPSSVGFTALRDAFENFLERGGVANRSLFFSPPSAATVAPGEGEALLKLHLGLTAMARLVPGDTTDQGELYRDDAASIVQRALQNLSEADDGIAGRSLREALKMAFQRLETPGDGRLREVLRPVENALWSRLTGLYEYFWKETCTRPGGGSGRPPLSTSSGASTPSRTSFSSPEPRPEWKRSSREVHGQELHRAGSGAGASVNTDLSYEPRKKGSTSKPEPSAHTSMPASLPALPGTSTDTSHAQPHSTSGPSTSVPTERSDGSSAPPEARTAMQPPPVPARKENLPRPAPRRGEPPSSRPEPGLEITVTDVSPNADRQTAAVDTRTFEVMIAVEGLISDAGGFVLLRNWKDFQQLNEELSRSVALPSLRVPLPDARGKTSAQLTQEIRVFLEQLLTSPVHMTSDAVQYFVDKARAGEEANVDRMGVLLDSLQLNKGFDFGRSLASGVVNTFQKGTRAAVAKAPTLNSSGSSGSVAEVTGDGSRNRMRGAARGVAEPIGDRTAELLPEQGVDGPELAHLPIGMRKSHSGVVGSEGSPRTGLGISAEKAVDREGEGQRQRPVPPPPFGVAPVNSQTHSGNNAAANRHRRSQSSDIASPKVIPPPLPGRSPTAPQGVPTAVGGKDRLSEPPPLGQMRGQTMQTGMPPPPSPEPTPPSEMSQADLDNLLSCLFAIADEAFNLSGGWTFRRGMLRVFEQIVRTQYWSSILGVFNNMVHSLNHEHLGNWCTDIKAKFWPDEVPGSTAKETQPSHEKPGEATADVLGDAVVEAALEASQAAAKPDGHSSATQAANADGQEKRTVGQRAATHAQAQAILLSHVPASSAYFLGPGGRQSCERAVMCLHEEICQPSTSMDLVLTVVLKLCDIAAR